MSSKRRKSPGEIAHDYLTKGDPSGWFEEVYAASDTAGNGVPWADMRSNPYLVNWLLENKVDGGGKTALVVGCGLGDDADALAKQGFEVTAFDISASAIELCRQRFPRSPVKFQVADLFAAPVKWQSRFDFVFENITVQALPPDLQDEAIKSITQFVAPGGHIMVITTARDPEHTPGGPPWPLSQDSMNNYLVDGISEVFQHTETLQEDPSFWHIQVLYRRAE